MENRVPERKKKMQTKIPKICTDTLESLTDCKAAHMLEVKYMRQRMTTKENNNNNNNNNNKP